LDSFRVNFLYKKNANPSSPSHIMAKYPATRTKAAANPGKLERDAGALLLSSVPLLSSICKDSRCCWVRKGVVVRAPTEMEPSLCVEVEALAQALTEELAKVPLGGAQNMGGLPLAGVENPNMLDSTESTSERNRGNELQFALVAVWRPVRLPGENVHNESVVALPNKRSSTGSAAAIACQVPSELF